VGSGTERPTRASSGRAGLPHQADGRIARGEQTRRLLAEALVDLVDDGASGPTTRQVADRAGVSLRLVFHHFRDARGLHVAAVALQSERHRDTLFAIPPRGPPDLRIRALCRQRRLYFEGLAPVYRVAAGRPGTDAALRDLLADDRERMRTQLAGTLAPEVAARGPDAESLLDALEQATGWEAWWALRFARGRTPAAAERSMAATAGLLLA